MRITPRQKRFYTITLVVVVFAGLMLSGFYLWFIHNTTTALQRMVTAKSNGMLALEVKKIRFNPFTHLLSARQAYLYSTDTLHQAVTYDVRVRSLDVQVSSVWELLVHRKLLLDTIELQDPMVQVTRRFKAKRAEADTAAAEDSEGLSIAQEIGKVYNGMLNGLENFGINRIRMQGAGFRLVDMTRPELQSTFVNNIDLNLLRQPNTVRKRDAYVEGAQSLDVQIDNQDIYMPNGRHRLSFSRFRLELFRQRVVLDSCTITAIATDSARSSYTVFFDSLMLVGVDFGAMYRSNVLRADSVYCMSPVFDIKVDNSVAPVAVPDPAKIIREFTSDMDMKYLAVKDATVQLDVKGRKNRALVNSNADNFEIRGLRVYADSLVPVAVDEFDLRVSDYKLYNADSTTVYAFDSVHFRNNTIALSNFSVITTSHPNRVRNERSFEIPHFALVGLDWYQLILEQNLRAREAVLYHPDIRYKRNLPVQKQSQSQIISSLHTLDSLLTLDRITIVNGSVNASLGSAGSFEFEEVDLLVNSNRVLSASGVTELRDALQRLAFSNGRIRYGNMDIDLKNVRSANGLVQAGELKCVSTDGSVNATIHDAVVGNILLDNKTESALVDGIQWSGADIDIRSLSMNGNGSGTKTQTIALRNLVVNNTRLTFASDSLRARTFIKSMRVAAFEREADAAATVQGLYIDGKDFSLQNAGLQVRADNYTSNNQLTTVNGLVVKHVNRDDSLLVDVPRVQLLCNVNYLLKDDIRIDQVEAFQPAIRFSTLDTEQPKEADSAATALQVRIDRLILHEPQVNTSSTDATGTTTLALPTNDNGLVELTNFRLDTIGFGIGALKLNTDAMTVETSSGEKFEVDNGRLNVRLKNIQTVRRDDKLTWNALVDSLRMENGVASLAVKNGVLSFDTVHVGNVQLSSTNTGDQQTFAQQNPTMWIEATTGSYVDSAITVRWYDATRDATTANLTMDSFVYRPTLSQDDYIARSSYQTDYVTFNSGALSLDGLRFSTDDSAYAVQHVILDKPVITAYRDKKAPFQHGIIKPLPTEMIRRIAFPLNVQRVDINDGIAAYTERHPRTRNVGTISLNRMRGTILNVKNYGLEHDDSLTMTLDAWLLDTVGTHVIVKQSYGDTLNTFRISVWLEPAPLPTLNPVLAPLMNVAVVSGQLDSFSMDAVASEYIAIGEMDMFYHDLRVRLLKDGDMNRKSFQHRIISKYINAVIVKSNNRNRTAVVFFERDRERSFFNYLVKMTTSGMGTSMGFKRSERDLDKYNRSRKDRGLPPVKSEMNDPALKLDVPQTLSK